MTSGNLLARGIAQTLAAVAVMGAILLGAAGDWRWPQAWAFLVIFTVASAIVIVFLLRHDPGLLNERLGGIKRKKQAGWDTVFMMGTVFAWCAWLGLMALDARRWHSSVLPVWLEIIGGLLVITGIVAVLPVFAANSFAAPVVRLQSERGQHVIDTGPYALVRHPMYASAMLYLIGMPLLLGSQYGLIGTLCIAAAVAWRATKEEQMLARELTGYTDYMTRVPWRLVPYVW
ncbi:MAG TPA: isoprenylcysteine carboxylmethyltransferase family protein [Rhizomicrobium sp.]|nr:isoprenylcysteine carboxylmethyltransferase family protein [Rhizomicrobium sp.]